MSEGNSYNLLKSPASDGDSMDIGFDNPGGSTKDFTQTDDCCFLLIDQNNKKVENDTDGPTLEASRPGSQLSELSLNGRTAFEEVFPKKEKNGPEIHSLEDILKEGVKCDWENIKKAVTASALCEEENPIDKAFDVHKKLRQIAKTSTENTKAIEKLADRVEDFAYDLLDQVKRIEEEGLLEEAGDRYASLFSEITAKAIAKGQKKFVSHPFIFKRVEKRWKLGLSEDFQSRLPHRLLLLLIMMLDAILTPVLLPLNAFVGSKDQQGHFVGRRLTERRSPGNKTKKRSRLAELQVIYRDYLETPYVIFMKTQFMQLVFIGLFFRISMIGSSVAPTVEESLILLFFCGFVLSEIKQFQSSASKIYLRDMWNYLDVLIMLVYAFVITSRIATIIIGGEPYNNRLLELANYGYGFDAMLLILRFSSILELSSVIGPLQLALFRMCVDLLVILIQFGFVIAAFSLAITKCYIAETSFLTPSLNNGSNNAEYCVEGSLNCFSRSARQLVWSVFGMTHFEEMESITSLTSDVVVFLYLVFLVLSVIMLVNILVALLTTTYNRYKTNAEIEWKFSRAVVEEQYRRLHIVVVPFNIISEPLEALYFAFFREKHRDMAKDKRKEKYDRFFRDKFFPELIDRYKSKYKGSFPASGDSKLDTLGENLEFVKKGMMNLEAKLEFVTKQLERISQGDPKENAEKKKKKGYYSSKKTKEQTHQHQLTEKCVPQWQKHSYLRGKRHRKKQRIISSELLKWNTPQLTVAKILACESNDISDVLIPCSECCFESPKFN